MAGLRTPNPSDCPSVEALKALLHLDVSDPSSSGLRLHIRTCQTCQQTLDELTSRSSLGALRKALAEVPSELADLTKIKQQIRQMLIDAMPDERVKIDSRFEISGSTVNQPTNSIIAKAELANVEFSRTERDTASAIPSLDTVIDALVNRETTGELPSSIGRFCILSVLGSGGMGTVFLAFDPTVNRKVAIKTINGQRSELRQRLEREAEAIGRIDSERVVRLFSLEFDERGNRFIVMEYVDGETLSARLARVGKLNPNDAAAIAMMAARGVADAHACGVLHRDIKPGNVLIDQNGRIKVADFGLATFTELSPRLTRQDNLPGTAPYFSPELVRGGQHSVASDVYSLGCVLQECLTGKPALTGTPMEIINRLASDQIPALDAHGQIPRPLCYIRDRAMAVDPRQRYATATELADDLQRWLRGEPIWAQPESSLQQVLRSLRRRPRQTALVGLLSALVAAIAIYAAWATWQSRSHVQRAASAHREAVESTAEADRQRELALKQLQQTVFETQDMLKDRSGTLELRKSLLASAIAGLEQVAPAGGSPPIDRSTALAHLRLGQIQLALGDVEAGRGSLKRAEEIMTVKHLASEPDAQSCRDLAAILNSLGETEFSQRNHAGAQSYFEQALELREIAFELDPGLPADSTAYSMNLIRLGDVANATGDGTRADDYYQRVLSELAARYSDGFVIPETKRNFSVALNRLFVRAMSRGDINKARELIVQCSQITAELLQAAPHNLEYQNDHALALAQTARLSLMQDDFDAATRFANQATEAYRAMAQAEPESASAQSRWAIALHQEADAWNSAGDSRKARDQWAEAAGIHDELFSRNPSNTRFALLGGESWLWLGITELGRGEIDSGLKALDKAVFSFKKAEAGANNDPQVVQPVEAIRQLVEQLTASAHLLDEEIAHWLDSDPTISIMCGFLLSRTDRIDEALAVAEHWRDFESDDTAVMVNVHSQRAAIYAKALDNAEQHLRGHYREEAISSLQKSLEAQPKWLAIMRKSPDYRVLRSDPAYQNLLLGSTLR